MKKKAKRILTMILTVMLVFAQAGIVSSIETMRAKAANISSYMFDTTTISSSGISDKQAIEEGTTYMDGFYTIVGEVTQRLTGEGLTKCIEIGRALSGGLEFVVDGYALVTLKVSSTGTENTSPVALMNVADGSFLTNEEGLELVSATGATKLTYYLEGGTYRVVSPENADYARGVRLFSIETSVSKDGPIEPRKDWNTIDRPAFTDIVANGSNIDVYFTGTVGYDGADYVEVSMTYDDDKTVVQTLRFEEDSTEGMLSFSPKASGKYTFNMDLVRTGYEAKSVFPKRFEYILPVAKANILTASSVGNGGIKVTWAPVAEATDYELYCDGAVVATTEKTSATVEGLTIDQSYDFQVIAHRDDEIGEISDAVSAIAYKEAVVAWGFTRYGSSTNDENNGFVGNIEDGSITVYSEGGKGKIVPNSTDGIAFYYTAVPTNMNFTLKATANVDSWTFSNGQDGFGLIATDRLGTNGDSTAFWNNQYMAVSSKIEYYWDSAAAAVAESGNKYSMKLGLGVIAKTGVTKDNLALLQTNDTQTVTTQFHSELRTLEATAPLQGLGSGTYNIVGNATAAVDGTIAENTQFTLEIQKNNTGYFITYYDENGNMVSREKFYEPDALSMVDDENVYVGFFASRNARVTFTDIEFSTIAPADDAPAEERPVTTVTPKLDIVSSKVANADAYKLTFYANVDGEANVTLDGVTVAEKLAVSAGEKASVDMTIVADGENRIELEFTPDANYVPGDFIELANTDVISTGYNVSYQTKYAALRSIYVAPNGSENGTGREDSPIDIYTAVKVAQPGQTIVITEGTYNLKSTVRIDRGISGREDALITMTADPNAATRPVFDFGGNCAGMNLGGDYWYFYGFDCTNSQNGQKGIQVSGNHNTLDLINAYHNGNTGIQISRMFSTDNYEDWPSYNLILNCTSYGNADSGYEDADGFAAKLTIGDGNVFDGCVAYNNADDGWDLFAKVETGSIGSVTIQNCVAYGNGYLEDGTNAGNGNGFKMGGDSLSGYHKLINSFAFNNKAKGIDSNSCPDIQVEDSTSYNNESYNVAFYTNNAANTDFGALGILSYKDENVKNGLATAEQFKPVGSQDTAKYLGDANYYWNGSISANASGTAADASWFVSTEFTGVTRNADGTVNMNGFLDRADGALAGAKMSGTPSKTIVIPENPTEAELVLGNAENTEKNSKLPVFIGLGVACCGGIAGGVIAGKRRNKKDNDNK